MNARTIARFGATVALALISISTNARAGVFVSEGNCVTHSQQITFLCPPSGSYELSGYIWDKDFAAPTDDKLDSGGKSGKCEPGSTVSETVSGNLCCQDGEIRGDSGGSGEGCAEVYVDIHVYDGTGGFVAGEHGAGSRFPDWLAGFVSFGLYEGPAGNVQTFCCGP